MKRTMNKWFLAGIFLCICLKCWSEERKDPTPIRVIVNDWTSQIVLARITGQILEGQGYNVEYPTVSTAEQWGALALGVDHIQIEVWQGTMDEMFTRMVRANRILDAGSHSAKTREDWWYPKYVELACPGLPDWKALKKCSHLFVSGKTSGKPRYVAGPWEKPEAARVRALDLGFVIDQVEKADDLWEELKQAKKENRAIVLFNWTPNWIEDRFDGAFVEFPDYDPLCETDPSWGANELYLHDCGNPKNGWLKKAAWSGMPKKWDCAYRTLQNINFGNAAIASLSAHVDVDGKSHEDAAEEWMEAHESLWRNWVPGDCR